MIGPKSTMCTLQSYGGSNFVLFHKNGQSPINVLLVMCSRGNNNFFI